ncbi:MAG: hypothetical protein ABI469_09720 [Gemmatimonadales bacterium]
MTKLRSLLFAMLALATASGAMSAQTTPPKRAPMPCPSEPERHRFDFWIGEWDVATKSGSPQGKSVIQSVSGGCALLENWTSLNGGNGKSLNAYNPQIKQWQQYWIGQDGQVTEYRGSAFDGTSLTFFEKNDAKPDSVGRLTFTPVDKETVRQHAEISTDGGKTWATAYDLYYHRKTK